jgi:cation-transporting ATPase 13A1
MEEECVVGTMSVKQVGDELIRKVTLFRPMFWLLRYDVLPFMLAYCVLFGVAEHVEEYRHVSFVGIPIVLCVHILLFMMSQYSVGLRCRLGNVLAKGVSDCQVVHVEAAKNAGRDRIVDLNVEKNLRGELVENFVVCGSRFAAPQYHFEFQQVVYAFDSDRNTFVGRQYPSKAPLKDYLSYAGLGTDMMGISAFKKWGFNEFHIPVPNFLDLYVEHLVAPFFVFQMLCLVLWSMDDYWYYSVLTGMMLMLFEGMLCHQRQRSLHMMSSMRRPPMPVLVFRNNAWKPISSQSLLPGDIMSLTTSATSGLAFAGGREEARAAERARAGLEPEAPDETIIPCDALLLRGSCVTNEAMLTGESVPQLKESLFCADDLSSEVDLTVEKGNAIWKRHLISGGTALQLHTAIVQGDPKVLENVPEAPNGGCLAIVIRTGYGTLQGGLMRKILFATERVTQNSSETFVFIGCLVVFATIASSIVLHYGLQDPTRNRFKLFLHCIMIVTSVVPPELPMELQLAVTNSLTSLSHYLVYCTEPFRIPLAGRLDVLCFDKTGTLTKDEMLLRGIVAPFNSSAAAPTTPEAVEELLQPDMCPRITRLVMGSCHSLLYHGAHKKLMGDPLEVATMEASGFLTTNNASFQANLDADGNIVCGWNPQGPTSTAALVAMVSKRMPFTSALKRMSNVVMVEKRDTSAMTTALSSSGVAGSAVLSRECMVVTKGAPEVLESLLTIVPPFYRATYQFHMRQGKRVLTMASRTISVEQGQRLQRNALEKELTFNGFLIFDSDLKPDSSSVIRELRMSAHHVVMITGDGPLTAIDVARRLSMIGKVSMTTGTTKGTAAAKAPAPNKVFILIAACKTGVDAPELVWRSSDLSDAPEYQESDLKFDHNFGVTINPKAVYANVTSLCVTGSALAYLEQSCGSDKKKWLEQLKKLAPRTAIFSRVSPVQKETIIHALNAAGKFTLMVGDGTNDVGALKAAHVGVSIVNAPELESRIKKKSKELKVKSREKRMEMELAEQEMDPTLVKLGDASIASPFTSRRTSIDSVMTVLRHGRCSLVTTVEVYKILALNCLVSAYMMSTLYLRGMKQGDFQMTAMGLATAALFYFLSQAKPITQLSVARPPKSVFDSAVIVSILGQFAVHFGCLLLMTALCESYSMTPFGGDSDNPSVIPDGRFRPSVINTSMFLLSAVMQTNSFVINYRGQPFTQDITDNFLMFRGVQLVYAVLFIAATGLFEPLSDLLELAPFPDPQLRSYVFILLFGNFGACWAIEQAARKLE